LAGGKDLIEVFSAAGLEGAARKLSGPRMTAWLQEICIAMQIA